MNIFAFDPDPELCAKWLSDKHVIKMISESTQMLASAHRILFGKEVKVENRKLWVLEDERLQHCLPQVTHRNHPCTVWARTSNGNYMWLVNHAIALCDQYEIRWPEKLRAHAFRELLEEVLISSPLLGLSYEMTPFAQAMPDEYKIDGDPYQAYKNYYIHAKKHTHLYRRASAPPWLDYVKLTDQELIDLRRDLEEDKKRDMYSTWISRLLDHYVTRGSQEWGQYVVDNMDEGGLLDIALESPNMRKFVSNVRSWALESMKL